MKRMSFLLLGLLIGCAQRPEAPTVRTDVSGDVRVVDVRQRTDVKFIDPFDGRVAVRVAADDAGAFAASLNPSPPFMWIEGEERSIAAMLLAVEQGQENAVHLTAITTLGAAYARALVERGAVVAGADMEARLLVFGHFGKLEHGRWAPRAPVMGAALTAPNRTWFFLEGLRELARTIGSRARLPDGVVTPEDIVTAWANDLSDGAFDGASGTRRLDIFGVELDGDTPRRDYAAALVLVIDRVELDETSKIVLRDLARRVAENDSELFSAAPAAWDQAAPVVESIRFVGPSGYVLPSGFVRDGATVEVTLEDPDEAVEVTMEVGDTRVRLAASGRGIVQVPLGDLPLIEGRTVFRVAISDEEGNETVVSETAIVDLAPPVLTASTSAMHRPGEVVVYGRVDDASPVTIEAVVDGERVAAAELSSPEFSLSVPAPCISEGKVTVTATDRVSHRVGTALRLSCDTNPPELTWQTSTYVAADDIAVSYDVTSQSMRYQLQPGRSASIVGPGGFSPEPRLDVFWNRLDSSAEVPRFVFTVRDAEADSGMLQVAYRYFAEGAQVRPWTLLSEKDGAYIVPVSYQTMGRELLLPGARHRLEVAVRDPAGWISTRVIDFYVRPWSPPAVRLRCALGSRLVTTSLANKDLHRVFGRSTEMRRDQLIFLPSLPADSGAPLIRLAASVSGGLGTRVRVVETHRDAHFGSSSTRSCDDAGVSGGVHRFFDLAGPLISLEFGPVPLTAPSRLHSPGLNDPQAMAISVEVAQDGAAQTTVSPGVPFELKTLGIPTLQFDAKTYDWSTQLELPPSISSGGYAARYRLDHGFEQRGCESPAASTTQLARDFVTLEYIKAIAFDVAAPSAEFTLTNYPNVHVELLDVTNCDGPLTYTTVEQ